MLSKYLSQIFKIDYGRNYIPRRTGSFFKHVKEVKEYEEGKEDFDPEKPLRFSTSPAANWNIRHIRLERNPIMDASWGKILLWLTFLMGSVHYLNFYREGNDIDEELDMPLGKRVLQIREMQTKQDRNRAISAGQSTTQYDDYLKEIERLRKKYKYDDD